MSLRQLLSSVGFGFALILFVPGPVLAQEGEVTPRDVELQLFLPPASAGTTFTIDAPRLPPHLGAVFGIVANYANGLAFRRNEIGEREPVVPHLAQFEAHAALGLFQYLEFGVMMPLVFAEALEDPYGDGAEPTSYVGAGDLRMSAKVPFLRDEVGIAARLMVHLPTGSRDSYMSNGYWIATPSIIMDWRSDAISLGAELGYRMRTRRVLGDTELDDEVIAAVGAAIPIIPELDALIESRVRMGIGGRQIDETQLPAEANAGLRIRPMNLLTIDVGAGLGFGSGLAAPSFRTHLAIRIRTDTDTCEFGPEDNDGFDDGDFCADPNNDGDALDDIDDVCPNDAEDVDRFQDEDGCPDTDNDADGQPDQTDACPTQSEDRDGYQDDDGCPEPDNDADGVPDGLDECPMDPEDLDNFRDEDGCPELGPERATVTVTDSRILISERIYFEFDRDTIRSVSTPLLDQVAQVIARLNANLRIRVDGHTDNEGGADYNLDLSYRRARAVVEYLVGRGVARDRLEYRGYGSQSAVAPNDDPAGRALNRRVEFTILHPER